MKLDFKSYLIGKASGGGGGTKDIKLENAAITENGVYQADSGYDGFGIVKVEVPETELESLTVEENGTYTAEEGKGFNEVVVDVPSMEPIVLTGDVRYAFYDGVGKNWIDNLGIENISIHNATQTNYTFAYYQGTELPQMTADEGIAISASASMFNGANKIKEIPYGEDIVINSTSTSNSVASMFADCYSLRKVPQFVKNIKSVTTGSSSIYYNMFKNSYVLDEITDLPVCSTTFTNNAFTSTFSGCYRMARLTFEPNKTARWKTQTIELHQNMSCSIANAQKGGLTIATSVANDTDYERLKDNPDWYAVYANWSRYNHDSAVETINSLPDCSAYLASVGGTNTIKFNGDAGSATDGGAINTLTPEEIAVATAKGWTVTLV